MNENLRYLYRASNSFKTIDQLQMDKKCQQNLIKKIYQQDQQLFDEFHPYELVFFNNQITIKKCYQLFDQQSLDKFAHNKFLLNLSSIQDIQLWSDRFSLIVQSHHIQLKCVLYNQLYYPQLVNIFCHIDFTQMKELILYQCTIQNIQSLSFLNAPQLKKINFIYNNVVQYKSLNKAVFKLSSFFIYSTNKQKKSIKEEPFIKLNISRWHHQIKDFRLQKHNYNTVINQDISFIAKGMRMGYQPLNFAFRGERRIFQTKLQEKLTSQLSQLIQNAQYYFWMNNQYMNR